MAKIEEEKQNLAKREPFTTHLSIQALEPLSVWAKTVLTLKHSVYRSTEQSIG